MGTLKPQAPTFTFIELPPFTKALPDYLSDDDYAGLQTYIAMNPTAGDVIPASGGCRKLRWMRRGVGKQGGLRVVYYVELHDGRIILIAVYGKSDTENIAPQVLRKIMEKFA